MFYYMMYGIWDKQSTYQCTNKDERYCKAYPIQNEKKKKKNKKKIKIKPSPLWHKMINTWKFPKQHHKMICTPDV